MYFGFSIILIEFLINCFSRNKSEPISHEKDITDGPCKTDIAPDHYGPTQAYCMDDDEGEEDRTESLQVSSVPGGSVAMTRKVRWASHVEEHERKAESVDQKTGISINLLSLYISGKGMQLISIPLNFCIRNSSLQDLHL